MRSPRDGQRPGRPCVPRGAVRFPRSGQSFRPPAVPRGRRETPAPMLAALLLALLTVFGGTAPAAALAPSVPSVTTHLFDRTAPLDGPHADALTEPGRWAEAAPLPGPRAGIDRPHAPHLVPPPGHGALPPRPPGLIVPRGPAPARAGAAHAVSGRVDATLPGVRGPPGTTAGQPACHRSCSTDQSSSSAATSPGRPR
ncbi:hypothetical protein ACFY8O_24295 [Streptomyces argenteolus]|uniref:Uncharacterized protein n=1 Tax=Streptomyces argenteolus TaxID=67274 RepID=A0ABW6XAC2_9ACTN